MVSATTAHVQPKWQRQGYSSPEDYNWHRQNRRGTSSGRYAPRQEEPNIRQVKSVSAREMSILDGIYTALDATVLSESAYPKDSDKPFLFAEGETITLRMGEGQYRVRIHQRWNVFDRLRYRLHFVDKDVYIAVTQEQLVRLHEKPLLAIAPTHLLPAGDTHRLQNATFTSALRFARAKARLAANWRRQLSKVRQFETPLFGTVVAYQK